MKLLTSQEDFIEKLKQHKENDEKAVRAFEEHNLFEADSERIGGMLTIQDQDFVDKVFDGMILDSLSFKGCKFKNCRFDEVKSYNTGFYDCKFIKCWISELDFTEGNIHDCDFEDCKGASSSFSNSHLMMVTFSNCNSLSTFYFGGNICINVGFENSTLVGAIFEANSLFGEAYEFRFWNSLLSDCFYKSEHLCGSGFKDCRLERNSFIACSLSVNTFTGGNKCEEGQYSSIDLHTIVNSEEINCFVLEYVFGIKEPNIKSLINDIVADFTYQSVFISYSFEDKDFANALNTILKHRGVKTFLWKDDAPAGHRMKKIMSENIRKHDRLLFIASKNSLKSLSCHFELTEARKIQNKEWKDIYFPIHIDNYLFEIEEHDVRPREKREEIWNNILELREVNSMDFSQFNKPDYDQVVFEREVDKLIHNLRKKE